jgi:outer membrane immunogenic protein
MVRSGKSLRSVTLAASLLALSSAGSLGAEPYMPSLTDWSGFYAGGHGGYTWLETDGFAATPFCPICPATASDTATSSGGLFGGQIGYNMPLADLIVGVEADASGLLVNSTDLALKDTFTVDYDWLATVRGRAGITHDRALFYLTGGLALTEQDSNIFGSAVLPGLVVGGGVEYMVAPGWSLKAEYLYIDFLARDGTYLTGGPPAATSTSLQPDAHILRGGINIHF